MQGPARRVQERIGEVSAVAHESIDGALVVKTLGREDDEIGRLREKAEQLRDERVAAGYIRAGFEAALEALPTLAAIAAPRGRRRGASRRATSRSATSCRFVTLFGLLAWPMRFIGWILVGASAGRGRPRPHPRGPRAAGRDDERRRRPDARCRTARSMSAAESLTYGFDGASVLDEVSLPRRARTSRSRSSGRRASASRTLAQLLVRLDDPDEGGS